MNECRQADESPETTEPNWTEPDSNSEPKFWMGNWQINVYLCFVTKGNLAIFTASFRSEWMPVFFVFVIVDSPGFSWGVCVCVCVSLSLAFEYYSHVMSSCWGYRAMWSLHDYQTGMEIAIGIAICKLLFNFVNYFLRCWFIGWASDCDEMTGILWLKQCGWLCQIGDEPKLTRNH